jgi:hypothetical protein
MADNVPITAGSGTTVAADEVVDGTLGTVKVQFVKLMDGTLDGTNKSSVQADGSLLIDQINPATATRTSVAASATVVTLHASNTARAGLMVKNDSVSATLYLALGSGATTTDYTVDLAPGEYYELSVPVYTGIVTGIWTAAVGNARVTELT